MKRFLMSIVARLGNDLHDNLLTLVIVTTLLFLSFLLRIAFSPQSGGLWSGVREVFGALGSTVNERESIDIKGGRRDSVHPDIDLDGADDLLVFAPNNNPPVWYAYSLAGVDGPQKVVSSHFGKVYSFEVGESGSVPVEADYNGDGLIDLATFTPGGRADWQRSQGIWSIYISRLADGHIEPTENPIRRKWGDGESIPVPADYDGDGRADLGIYYPQSSVWKIAFSRDDWNIAKAEAKLPESGLEIAFGEPGDIPYAGDFDGDGRAELATYRISSYSDMNSSTWKVYYLTTGDKGSSRQRASRDFSIGNSQSWPLLGDFNCDRASNLAVYEAETLSWSMLINHKTISLKWGIPGAQPFAGDFDADGCDDAAFFIPNPDPSSTSSVSNIRWAILPSSLMKKLSSKPQNDRIEYKFPDIDISAGIIARIPWMPMAGKLTAIERFEYAKKLSLSNRKYTGRQS